MILFIVFPKQPSSHNFDPMSMDFYTSIRGDNINILKTKFKGQRSNAKVKVTILVISVFHK